MSGIEAFHFGVYRVQSATASYHVVSTKYAAHNVLDITRYSTDQVSQWICITASKLLYHAFIKTAKFYRKINAMANRASHGYLVV